MKSKLIKYSILGVVSLLPENFRSTLSIFENRKKQKEKRKVWEKEKWELWGPDW